MIGEQVRVYHTSSSLRTVLTDPASVTWVEVPDVLISNGVSWSRGRQGEDSEVSSGSFQFTCVGDPVSRGDVVQVRRVSTNDAEWTGVITEASREWQGGEEPFHHLSGCGHVGAAEPHHAGVVGG